MDPGLKSLEGQMILNVLISIVASCHLERRNPLQLLACDVVREN